MIERARVNLKARRDGLIRKSPSMKRVLLVDDEPYNIEALKFMFKSLNLSGFPDSIDCCYDAE